MGRYCSNCPLNGKGSDECISCNSVSAEYSNPHGRYLFDGYQPPQPDVSGSEQVTSLPDEVEDTIRKFLFRLFDLTPNELLCLQAIMRGKDLTAFGKDMERLSQENAAFSRFRAFQTRKSILKKLGDGFAGALLTPGQRRPLKG